METSGNLVYKDVQFGAALGDEYPGENKAHSQGRLRGVDNFGGQV